MRKVSTFIVYLLLVYGCGSKSDPGNVAVYLDFYESDYLALNDKKEGNSTNLLKVTSGEGELTPVGFLNADKEFIDDDYFELNSRNTVLGEFTDKKERQIISETKDASTKLLDRI